MNGQDKGRGVVEREGWGTKMVFSKTIVASPETQVLRRFTILCIPVRQNSA